jgi:orotate phosphoribosyltransferase
LVVKDVVVLIDRNQGGKEQLARIGLYLHSALLLTDMLAYYLRKGKINNNIYQDTINRLDLLSKYSS